MSQQPFEQLLGLPSEIITPSGQPAYLNPYTGTYSTSRSYAMRMQRGYRRGVTQQIARGKRAGEARTRAQRTFERYGITETERFGLGFERRYGFSYKDWRRWRRLWISEINRRTWPQARSYRMQVDELGQRKDPRIFPEDVAAVKTLYDQGYTEIGRSSPPTWQQWVETRLAERLAATIAFQDLHDRAMGQVMYNSRSQTWASQVFIYSTGPPIEWWFYH